MVDPGVSGAPGVAEVATPDGVLRRVGVGETLVIGRSPGQGGLPVAGDPFLSRRAVEVAVLTDGVRVRNLSRKHALHVRLGEDLIRLPAGGGSDVGCFLVAGLALVGSDVMLTEGRMVRITLPDRWNADELTDETPVARPPGPTTQRPIRLRPETKDFMVAFLLCRPWLEDQTRMAALPGAREILVAALELTGAHNLLGKLATDSVLAVRLGNQVDDHLRTLRRRLRAKQLVPDKTHVSASTVVSALLHYDVIGTRHLALPKNASWLSAQEDIWWATN